VTVQDPDERVQLAELKFPAPGGVAVKDTVSPLVDPYAPETVAVQVEGVPTTTGLVHSSVVVVLNLPTCITTAPQLAALSVSPG
jgi:hypothetical protein